jgi:hypothetical protein
MIVFYTSSFFFFSSELLPAYSLDHPGFTDEVYKKRRGEIADIAYRFKGTHFFLTSD